MRKIIKLISIVIILFIMSCFGENANAVTTGTVYLQSNKSIFEKGEELEIAVFIENAKTVSFSTDLYFDNSKLEYIPDIENANLVDNNHILLVWYDSTGGSKPKEGELVKYKFKAKESGIVTFHLEGEFYDETRELIQTVFKDVQVQIGREEVVQNNGEKEAGEQQGIKLEQGADTKTDNATLQVLRLDKEGIIPSFHKDVYEYYLTVSNDIDYIDVLAIAENQKSMIEITGNNNLKEGLNIITIKVTSEDKTQNKIYKIQVTKTNNIESANTNLETLAVENILLNPPFDTNITHYSIHVANTVSILNILAVPQNENAKIEIIGNDNLKEGNNTINVIVTAQNGFSKRIYEIICYKRNQQEEDKFQEEQKENMEKFEQIYETEQVSENIKDNKKDTIKVIAIVVLSICVIVVVAIYWGKYLKK